MLPDSAIYHVNDESTSKYLVETDPAFTNKHNFLSSDYMYEQMKWDPDKVAKRLGDGFYEQDLIRQQITSLTGKRYLESYESEEAEYKALMDAGVTYAKEQHLTPGVALTKEQIAALTSDIVWLETTTVHVGGKDVQVVYPHVYLRANSGMTLSKDGSLMSGNQLIIDTQKEIQNAGTLYGNTVIAKGGNITNTGHIEGKTVDLSAIHDIHQQGLILGGTKASLTAGGNIDMGNTVEHGKSQDILSTTAGIAVKDKDGVLLMSAGKDLHLTGATLANLGKQGSTILKAGGSVTMDTDKLTAKKDMTENSDNYLRTYRSTETANTILCTGNISVEAGTDAKLRNTSVTSGEGKVTVKAGNDVTIENGETESRDEYGIKYKEHGFLSSKTTTIKSDDYHKGITGSTISGNEVTIQSGKDTNITASNVVGQKDTTITAGGNVTIDAAQQVDNDQYEKQVKKSGLLSGGGLGFTIGSEKRKDTYAGADTTQIGSTVGSVEGNVTISAHKDIDIKASDVVAEKDVNLTGENVNISSKDNIIHNEEKHEYKRTGLSVSLGGSVVDVAGSIAGTIQRGTEVSDKRLAALYGYEAGKQIQKSGNAIKNAIAGNGGIGLSVGFGSASSRSESTSIQTEAAASHVTAGGDVNVTTRKDINIHGSDVSGKNVNLKAGGNINISSAEQTNTNTTNQSSKGGSLGVTFGGGLPVTVSGNIYSGKEKENGTVITHRGSTVNADQTLTVESGNDTTILGSKAEGNKVIANIGGNLNIESQQDRNDYDSHSSSMGAGFDTGIASGHTRGSAGVNQGKIDSNYQSVTEQAGIYAGKEGFNISIKGNTDLKGAVIDSQAPAEKNKLTTGTLTWENTENKADYNASGDGVSYAGKDAPLNTKGLTPSIAPTVKGNANSTTKSAVAKGTITITNEKDQKQNVSDLNRDMKNTLNKLHEIFDKNKVKEKQEFIGLLNKDLNKEIHKLAHDHNWDDGSKEKAALHAIAGGMISEMSGAGFNSGALAGGVNEYVVGYLKRTKHEEWMDEHPDLVEWLSTAIGGAIGKEVGGNDSVGVSVALDGTKWNYYGMRYTAGGEVIGMGKFAALVQPDGSYRFYVNIDGTDVEISKDQIYAYTTVWVQDPAHPQYGWTYVVNRGKDQEDMYFKGTFDSMTFDNKNKIVQYHGLSSQNWNEMSQIIPGFKHLDTVGDANPWINNGYNWKTSFLNNTLNERSGDMWEFAVKEGKWTGIWKYTGKLGGPVGIPTAFIEPYQDYHKYSGKNLAKAWTADLFPVAGGFAGSYIGPWGTIGGGVGGDYLKSVAKQKIKTDKELKDEKEEKHYD